MDLYKLMKNRRSTRKFLLDKVSEEEIRELISAAVTAPSGCNSQCWKFIAVSDKDKIEELAKCVECGVKRFYADAEDANFISSRIKQSTFFRNAPLVIIVYLTDMAYHDKRVTDYYAAHGMNGADMLDALGNPDILSVGAAVENMLLKAEEMGLGACWMNDPVVAEQEISAYLGMSERRLLSVIPVGKSVYTPREKVMKPMEEILEIL